jgi:hypothetical protein
MDSGHEMKVHERTYDGFIGLLKWSIPPILVIVAVVVLLIA